MSGAPARVAAPQLYRACVNCHGNAGEGSTIVGAPRIAGLPQWYVATQLQRFQDGIRGKHPDDVDGLRMRAMARQMLTREEVSDVAGYVAGFPAVTNPPASHAGNAEAGKAIFVRCQACHGLKGEGNQQLNAPPLAGQDDWYVARQLRKFRAGIRGKAIGDPTGPIMQAMSLSLTQDNVDDIAAYVHSLPR